MPLLLFWTFYFMSRKCPIFVQISVQKKEIGQNASSFLPESFHLPQIQRVEPLPAPADLLQEAQLLDALALLGHGGLGHSGRFAQLFGCCTVLRKQRGLSKYERHTP